MPNKEDYIILRWILQNIRSKKKKKTERKHEQLTGKHGSFHSIKSKTKVKKIERQLYERYCTRTKFENIL